MIIFILSIKLNKITLITLLIKNSIFQIHSYENAEDNDEENLLSAPFVKELCKFIGVSLTALESKRKERRQNHRTLSNVKVSSN